MFLPTDEQLNTLDRQALVIIVSALKDQIESMQKQLDAYQTSLADNNCQIELLTEQLRLMNQRQFGRKSETAQIDGQLSFFDAFNEAEVSLSSDSLEPEITEVIVSSFKRSKTKGQRDLDLDGLPARIFEHQLSSEELAAKFPNGYKELPVEIHKRLYIVPETFIVDEHHVHVYASKKNNGTIIRAERPVDLFRNSIATAALVASIINAKYVNAIPLERLSKAYKSNGIKLETNTLANWVIRSAERYFSILYDRLHQEIYNNHVIHADETPVKVMRPDGNKMKNGKKTYMWVYRNTPSSLNPVVLFEWQSSRRADHPREFLKGFTGTLVTDGYQVYHKLENEREDLNVAGCWVHARRRFADIIKSIGTKAAKGSIAEKAYAMITEIMYCDNQYDDLPVQDRLTQRQLNLTKKVDDYFAWIKQKSTEVGKQSNIGKALSYSIHQEKYLRTFLTDGAVSMDNNYAEQAIRPFTVGRKNFVMIESANGAKASAMLYSIVETAKANGLNTYQYLELLLTEIPKHMEDKSLDFIDNLLPWSEYVQKSCPSKYKNN